jgi:hypothetical protein
VNDIEDRLRDAYRSATDTVRPEAIRSLGERATWISRSSSWWAPGTLQRLMVPLTAAAAVVVVGVVAAVVVPNALHDVRNQGKNQGSGAVTPIAGDPATHFLVGLAEGNGSYLSIRSAITGAAVATIAPPAGGTIGTAATGNGISYVVAVWGSNCGSRLYRFTISRTGKPSVLTAFTPHYLHEMIEQLAVSRNGRTLAFAAQKCVTTHGPVPADLGVIDLATRQLKEWSVPGQADLNPLSLTADGRLLEYSIDLTKLFPSAIYMLPTRAAQGTAAERSRLVVRGSRFGASAEINSAVMTPDGATIYFSTNTTGRAYNNRWELRKVSVKTGKTRLIAERHGFPEHFVANPSVSELIAFVQALSPPPPSPSGTPSPSPSNLGPTVTPTPVPSGTPSSPTPVPSVPRLDAPRAMATLDAASVTFEVIRIQVPGGHIRYLNPAPWDVLGFYYVW